MKINLKKMSVLLSLLLLLTGILSCDEKLPPDQVISYERAKTLEQEFVLTRGQIINESLDIVDTREFWFSLDSLKRYIEYVEYEAGKQKLSNLGVRVYLAAYPRDDNESQQPGYSTVFFVPTAQQSASQVRQGFAPVQAENENIEGLNAFNYGHGGIPPNAL